ncbi:superfamily II DNA or RNA helicase [Ureibacillus xyleni]|uniref:Superfamily II DNA or RNA helicase n=1 Tax=Ureibacillus xyleni TaxID=614648 RepID=A0A285SXW6_9BACL|nr:DEAD/DEAH box helicase [Ureibacillus xyleni]SOC12906.1 superfamily II DNA or RNA helicase [Ureibacillus xyleni]
MKLNLQYISNVIEDEYLEKWGLGDTVLISSQTGTGKTSFVVNQLLDSLKPNEHMIYLCNRRKLSRDIKKSLLKKEGKLTENQIKKLDLQELDKQTVFGKVKVTTYQALAKQIGLNLDLYKYIILDEAHFILTDSSFNNKTHLMLYKLLLEEYPQSIRVFITATPDEIEGIINKAKYYKQLHTYETGRDYRYLDVSYFKKDCDMLQLIKNDESDDKWLIFVTSKTKGDKFEKELLESGIDVKFVHAKSTEDVIEDEKFPQKVLIATKFLDNGININDDSVKNLVVLAYDKTTFIQEVGRIRVDIHDARQVKLYIPTFKASVFNTKINTNYIPNLRKVELYRDSKKYFKSKYHLDHNKVPVELFYLDEETNEWQQNPVGLRRLKLDYGFATEMVKAFKDDSFAYVKVQLSWLELDCTFDESKLIEKVVDVEVVNELEMYLNGLIGKFLFSNERKVLIEKVGLRDNKNRIQKGLKTINSYLSENNINYSISSYVDKRRKLEDGSENPNRDKTYWVIN